MNIFTEALLFSEDLMIDFIRRCKLTWTPGTSANTYRDNVESKYTEAISNVVSNFSQLPEESIDFFIYDSMPCFSCGYNPRDFLHYCAVLAKSAATNCAIGNDYFADESVLAIASYLKEMKISGEFDKNGGWSAIQREAANSCVQWQKRTILNL